MPSAYFNLNSPGKIAQTAPAKAKLGVERLAKGQTKQQQRSAFARDERVDDRAAHATLPPIGHHHQRAQLAPAVIRFHLPNADDSRSAFFRHQKILPMHVKWIQAFAANHRLDGRLFVERGPIGW